MIFRSIRRTSLAVAVFTALAAIAQPAAAGPLNGSWHATGPRGSLERLIIFGGTKQFIHVYAPCSPSPCDWGTRPLAGPGVSVFGTGVPGVQGTAVFPFTFKVSAVKVVLSGSVLLVTTSNHFTDHSGRHDYTTKQQFQR